MAACLSACGPAPGVYDVGLHEAYTRLADNKLEDFKFARQCGILIHLVPTSVPDQHVTWRVFSSGVALLDFTVRLTAVDEDSTKVDIEVSKDPDGNEAYSGGVFYPRPAFHQPLRPAVEEAIASALQDRPFDIGRVPAAAEPDSVCNVQRAGLESGRVFTVNDDLTS